MMASPLIEPLEMGFRVRLRNGRAIGCAEYGDPGGDPLFWFPGTPGSRLAAPPDEELTRALGVRVITVERPGFGVSDPAPGRSVLDWPADFAEVADALGCARFAVAGSSGAGPYLTACALRLAVRITRVGMIGTVAPVTEPGVARGLSLFRRTAFAAARWAPGPVRLASRAFPQDPARIYRAMTRDAPACDRVVLDRIEDRQVRMTAEALRQGLDAFAWELHLAARPWGFSLRDIRAKVLLWHGEEDAATPVAMGRWLAQEIPGCEATFVEQAGHFLHFDRWGEILRRLVGSSRRV
jgi:pimeloyl-ACP methyl ester carboxylesterase